MTKKVIIIFASVFMAAVLFAGGFVLDLTLPVSGISFPDLPVMLRGQPKMTAKRRCRLIALPALKLKPNP